MNAWRHPCSLLTDMKLRYASAPALSACFGQSVSKVRRRWRTGGWRADSWSVGGTFRGRCLCLNEAELEKRRNNLDDILNRQVE